MKIYWIKAQAPRRVLALVKHLGIHAECIEMDLMADAMKTPSYLALNPNGKAPTLVDGDFVLWESSAIMTYLCIKAGSDMWPVDRPDEQVQVLRWLSWNDSHWSRAVGTFYFENLIKAVFHIGEPDPAELEAIVPEFDRLAAILDKHLEGRDFAACNRLTIADFQLGSMACDWREARMPMSSYPNIVRWLDGLRAIPGWADPWPVAETQRRPAAVHA
jgi:glutathione S-transferase